MSARKRIRILIADDHLVVRMGLTTLLEIEPDMEVVGEAADGNEAVSKTLSLKPDVVILDLMMPNGNGVETTRKLHAQTPETKILILTTYSDSTDIRRALEEGATSAIIKDADRKALTEAIRKTVRGERTISTEMRSAIVSPSPNPGLSPRNLEILGYVAKGLNNKEIAEMLNISRDCVKFHMKVISTRLGATSRAEAVAIALNENLLKI